MNLLDSRWIGAFAAPLVAFGGPPAAEAGPADGVIHFTGAIVAAAYDTSQAPAPRTRATRASSPAAQGQLVFERQAIDPPSAGLKVAASDGQALRLSFADSGSGVSTFGPGETRAIGRDGGTLFVAPAAGARASAALVTIIYD